MRILLSAYACEPGRGSEPGIGWNLALNLATDHEVWVITRANNEPGIRAALERDPQPNLHFAYFDLPRWMRWWKRGGRGLQFYYYIWQLAHSGLARRLCQEQGIDVVHHITFGRYWMPSGLSSVSLPFVWGPVGGADTVPKALRGGLGWRGRLSNSLRDRARWFGERDPMVRKCASRCSVALATTHATAERMSLLGAQDVRVLPAVAIPDREILRLDSVSVASSGSRVRFVSIGRLEHWKGFELGLRAFAEADLESCDYRVIGDGPERGRLTALVRSLDLSDRVEVMGEVDRDEVLNILSQSDVLVHPSYHDSGGWVCLEAMAAGLPVVCLDLAGPAVLVGETAGIKILPGTPRAVIERMATVMRELAADDGVKARLGASARRHVESEHTWTHRVGQIMAIYEEVVGSGSMRLSS